MGVGCIITRKRIKLFSPIGVELHRWPSGDYTVEVGLWNIIKDDSIPVVWIERTKDSPGWEVRSTTFKRLDGRSFRYLEVAFEAVVRELRVRCGMWR